MDIGGYTVSSLSLTGDDGVVRTSGNQTIRGSKTFTGIETFNGGFIIANTSSVNIGTPTLIVASTNTTLQQDNIYITSVIDTTIDSNSTVNIQAGSAVVPQTQPANSIFLESNVCVIAAGVGQIASAEFINSISSNGTSSGANLIQATSSTGGNYLFVRSGENLIEAQEGTNKLTSAKVMGNANLIEATATAGGNKLSATGLDGFNILEANGNNGYNTITATGALGNTMTADNGSNNINALESNILTALTSNILTIGLDPKITTTSNTNTITNTTNTISTSLGNNNINNTYSVGRNSMLCSGSSSANLLSATGANSWNEMSASGANGYNIIDGEVTNYININGIQKLVIRSNATTATDQMIAPTYRIGTYPSSVPLFSGCIWLQQIDLAIGIGSGASIAMSIGGFARSYISTRQGVLPFSVIITKAVFLSDPANQNTPRNVVLQIIGGGTAQVDTSVFCPTGAVYQSIVAPTISKTILINNGFFFQLYMDGFSSNPKSWNIQLYYHQI
jgi:hypothetical protein